MAKKTKNPTENAHTIETLEAKLIQTEGFWKRAVADYQNLEKRTKEQNGLMAQLAGMSLIEKILPIADHLELAQKHINDPGLTMVVKQLADVLEGEGLKKIDALGKPFEPQRMECVEQVNGEKDSVIEVISDGYMMGERVIRVAKVKVGSGN